MNVYKPLDVSAMNIYEVKKAYQSMRKAANKRIANIEKHGVKIQHYGTAWNKTGGLRMSSRGDSYRFPAASTMTNEELRVALSDVSLWMRDPAHTVRGEAKEREFRIGLLHDKGYDFVNDSNFYDFINYMDDLREQYSDKVFDSSAAADVFAQTQRIGIKPDTVKKDFDYFVEHLDELDRMKPVRTEKGATMPAIRRKIKRLEE